MSELPKKIARLEELTQQYDVIFSDVWGVLHNGVRAFPAASAALIEARRAGKAVVLITNAPRPHPGVASQLDLLGVPRESFDRIVTSGDVTRILIASSARRIHHIGPRRDLSIYDGLDVELVEIAEAEVVSCTGLADDDSEEPEDYAELLNDMVERRLPMICANPDIVVERGDRLIWCAGALARDYEALGGITLIAGKPHPPIYEAALKAASEVLGHPVERQNVLAIGDGIATDVKGAADQGIDLLFVSAGIHATEYGDPADPDIARLGEFLYSHGHRTIGFMPRLK